MEKTNHKKVYIPLQKFEHTAFAYVNDMESFLKLADALHQHLIFRLPMQNEEHFGIIHNQMVYLVASFGFHTIEDATDAFSKEFKNAADYYEAREKGLTSVKELEEMRKIGVDGREALKKLKQFGITHHWEEFLKNAEKHKELLPANFDMELLKSPEAITDYALQHGWRDFKEFEIPFYNGFIDKETSDKALKGGFVYARDFYDALEKGFYNIREYEEARYHGIHDKKEYDRFVAFKAKAGHLALDEYIFFEAIDSFENNKKISQAKAVEMYHQCIESLKQRFNGTLPQWFSCRLTSKELIIKFMKDNEQLKEIGQYDEEGEFFQISKISNELILIDGSNVAYSDHHGQAATKPYTANLIKVVTKLHELRYKNIVIIADASLKHRLDDWQEKSVELLKMTKYSEAPAKTTADEFLISRAKTENCRIVTNDTFRDWKSKDPWIATNIDNYRVPFMIHENQTVTLRF
jgi:hypothetical protein